MDDITVDLSGQTIDPIEHEVLTTVLYDSLGKAMTNFTFDNPKALTLFKSIQDNFKDLYPRRKKDKMWNNILVDEYCYDKFEYQTSIHKMLHIEVASYNSTDSNPLNNTFLNQKIRQTMSHQLKDKVNVFMLDKGEVQSAHLPPKTFAQYIVQCIHQIKMDKNIIDDTYYKCDHCSSKIHNSRNCPQSTKAEKTLRQEHDN